MSIKFQLNSIVLRNGAEFAQRTDYGGSTESLHLESNSAFKLPFAVQLPRGVTIDELCAYGASAWFKRCVGRMAAPDGVDFAHYKLIIRKNPCANHHHRFLTVVIERVYADLLPLDDNPSGYTMNLLPGLPTESDPIIAASHTREGDGWYTYKIYAVEA